MIEAKKQVPANRASAIALAVIERVAVDVEAAQGWLTELDSALGDGDHGVTMTIGMRALRRELPSLEGDEIAAILRRCGRSFQAAAGATVGALLGSALLAAAAELDGVLQPGAEDLGRAFQAANLRVQQLGKAHVGEKTIVDALDPAAAAFAEALRAGRNGYDALVWSVDAARRGMESTRDMVSTKGRASRIGERTRGHQDPGATSCYLILDSIARSLEEHARTE